MVLATLYLKLATKPASEKDKTQEEKPADDTVSGHSDSTKSGKYVKEN